MFQIGDKVLYPMHGAGIIEAIEEKEILGENRLYYILNIPHINMQIMIPMENTETLGIRQVVAPEIMEDVLEIFHEGETDPKIYDNQRYCRDLNKSKIKSGDIYKGTEIIRDLTRKSKKSKLQKEDHEMLNAAIQILTSELIQVKEIDEEQAADLIEQIIHSKEEETVSI